ncbi:MAG: flagellar filament capping protein FliD [Oceanospirillaceae bacterium]|nr:flagellar filament capping protein FliD [Oceanospirillaceae bacterium]
MASIESLGIGSDLLTSELVESIINADKAAGELRLNTQQDIIDAKISAYGEVQSKLYDFSEAIVALSDSKNVGATNAESSDESILTATATSSAPTGTYSVEVQRTAKSHSLVSKSFTSTTEAVGTGSLTFTIGTTSYLGGGGYDDFEPNVDAGTFTLDNISAGNNSLSAIRDRINDEVDGVRASIVNDGTGYVLQLTSEETGEDFSMEIIAKDENGALATTGLAVFAYNKNQDTPGNNMTETQQGEDALIVVNGLNITRSSNEITEVIDGVTLSLKGEDVGTNVSINVSPDISGISEKVQDMIDAYNGFQEIYKDLTKFDESSSTGSLLLGDSTLRSINTQIKNIMSSTVSEITGTNFRSLSELGVYTDQFDGFKLKFDANLFIKGLNENREAVIGVFATQGSTTDSQISYLNESINSKPGTYDINITQLATQGTYVGGSVSVLDFLSPVIINDANDDFSINVNGKTTAITLTQGSYTSGDDLASEIQLQINSAQDFKDRGYAVTVNFDSVNQSFDITSNAYGGSSQVYFSSVDSNTANTLGFQALGEGAFSGLSLTTLNSEYFNGYGASTVPGGVSVDEDEGINFAAANASFSISLNGGAAEAVTVNLNADGNDLNGDGIYGDRKDTLQAIQTAIDATALNGNVVASFDDSNKLVFSTTSPSSTDSIEITAVGGSATDLKLGLDATDGAQVNGKDPGLTFGSNVNFQVSLNGTTSANTVSLPAGTYLSGNDLATALQTAINTDLTGDANLSGMISGATTTEGTRDISTNIDFSTSNAGFTLNVNGNEQQILLDADSGNNISDIQAKLDAAYGAGVVTAQLGSGNGLELVTNATGHDQYIQVVSDGQGAVTSGGAVIAGGIDFSGANNATFDLVVDGITLNVDVNSDASSGDETDSLSAIQEALDLAILNNGQFEVGDVVAKLDGANQVYFETVSRNGVKTSAMFGSAASIEIQNADANAQATLGLPGIDTVYTGGFDALGMSNSIEFGSDITAEVSYEYDSESDKGKLVFNLGGNGNTVAFANLDASAISFLGMHEPDGTEDDIITGKNVEGTINGIVAKGNGQYLTAQNGNTAASNGYYVAEQSDILNGPVTIDATNDTFTIEVDGFEAVISVAQKTYGTGAELATAIQTAINNNASIKAEDLSVKVDYTSDASSAAYGTIGIISTSTGSDSKVLITDISSAASTAFGFIEGQADGELGKDQDGEIDDASGVRIKVEGGDLGDRGTVTYISGIADQLKDLLQGILDPTRGTLATKFDTLDKQNENLEEERESFDARIAATEARLKAQFLYNDSIIATLKTTENFLTQQFEAMAAAQRK